MPSPRVLMLTTIQLSALMLKLSCAGFPKRVVAKRCSWRCFLVLPEVPVISPVLPLGISGGTSGGISAYEIFASGMTGSSTGSGTGTTGKPEVPVCSAVLPVISSGAHFRSQYRCAPVVFWKLHRKKSPVVPLSTPVLPVLLPVLLPGHSRGETEVPPAVPPEVYSGSTGENAGTSGKHRKTAKPETE